MFGGEDTNATELGGNGAGGEGGMPSGYLNNGALTDSTGQSMGLPNVDSTNTPMGDPAEAASMRAEASADQYTNEASSAMTNAQNVSSGIGRSMGLFSAIEGLVGPRQKRLRASQRVYSRMQAQAAIDNANRALSQYKEDSAIQQQQLNQSYSGRGIGQSSIQQEGMQYFQDTQARKMAALQQNVQLAQAGQRLNQSQISASYAATWTSFGNSVAALV